MIGRTARIVWGREEGEERTVETEGKMLVVLLAVSTKSMDGEMTVQWLIKVINQVVCELALVAFWGRQVASLLNVPWS